MRDIKFRAWNKEFKTMDFGGGDLLLRIVNKKAFSEPMQFTGLRDRKGKSVYEGDIVEKVYVDPVGGVHFDIADGTLEVGFEHGQFVLYREEPQALMKWCDSKEGEYIPNYGVRTEYKDTICLQIVGNIYENPELLK